MVPKAGVLHILTYKYASRHSGVPFFNIGTSKSGPRMRCFTHFNLEICFAPQLRASFEHRNFQNSPDNLSFLAFSLANALGATAACHFSTSELPKWFRQPQFFSILTCEWASRHSRVPFFNIGTAKMAPTTSVFYHFHLQMRHSRVPFFNIGTSKMAPTTSVF